MRWIGAELHSCHNYSIQDVHDGQPRSIRVVEVELGWKPLLLPFHVGFLPI